MRFKQSLLENNSIKLHVSAKDWRDAIKIGTDMLIAAGAIEPRYYEAIIQNIQRMGPYIIIAPQLAFPHARPEDGVLKTAFALVTLKKPVYFDGESEPVDVFITLAGSSSDEHIQGLMEITQVLEDEHSENGINLDKLRRCRHRQEIFQIIDDALTVDAI